MVPQFSLLPLPSQYLHLPSGRVHYVRLGQGGPSLVLLHGLASSVGDWFPVTPFLADRFHLILIDLRGHGRSSLPVCGSYSMPAMAGDVRHVLDALQIDRAHMLGLSLGGCVALQLALSAPDRVDHLILTNTFAHLHHRGAGMLSRRAERVVAALRDGDTLAQVVAQGLFTDPEIQAIAYSHLRRNDLRVLRRVMWEVTRFDVRRRLHMVEAPTLALISDGDRTVPRRCADDLMAGLPHARLQVIAQANHALPLDQPEAFAQAVCDFLLCP